jgi:hypothetical protein
MGVPQPASAVAAPAAPMPARKLRRLMLLLFASSLNLSTIRYLSRAALFFRLLRGYDGHREVDWVNSEQFRKPCKTLLTGSTRNTAVFPERTIQAERLAI